jgi:hypothetical protein
MNIAWNAITKSSNSDLGYEAGFLDQLQDSIDIIAARGIKVVTNAGALNTAALTARVDDLCKHRGHGKRLRVASVYGDDITHLLHSSEDMKHEIRHLDHNDLNLKD